MKDGAHYGVRLPLAGHHAGILKQLQLGLPLAVAAGLETSAFGATAIFAGWLGEASLAAFQIALNVCTLAFMLTMGVSTAAGVRVANAIGRQNLIRKSHYCGCSRQVLYAVNASRRDATACGERTKIPGNSRRKRVPWSSMLSTSIMPLCSCTMP